MLASFEEPESKSTVRASTNSYRPARGAGGRRFKSSRPAQIQGSQNGRDCRFAQREALPTGRPPVNGACNPLALLSFRYVGPPESVNLQTVVNLKDPHLRGDDTLSRDVLIKPSRSNN